VRTQFIWAAVGLSVGLFWLAMAFGFFSGDAGLLGVILFDYLAPITCPPLFLGFGYFVSPFVNAALYGFASYFYVWVRTGKAPLPVVESARLLTRFSRNRHLLQMTACSPYRKWYPA
jgi:hypothetical protein